ncbi:hypothetical protein BaRGS_00003290 [Batillaria attramentaria]|uniref:Uncharacterized protein n=1 Tax=Batillaria attramentaria TaxID=370345 RepID=A0ABD0M1X3_9CAEN
MQTPEAEGRPLHSQGENGDGLRERSGFLISAGLAALEDTTFLGHVRERQDIERKASSLRQRSRYGKKQDIVKRRKNSSWFPKSHFAEIAF